MKLEEFYKYRTNCPICSKDLINLGKLDVVFDKQTDENAFTYGGAIYYKHISGNRFSLYDRWIAADRAPAFGVTNEEVIYLMEKLYSELPEILRIKKSYPTNLNKSELSKHVLPWQISFDFSFMNLCPNKKHSYYCESQQFFNQSTDSKNIKLWETLHSFGYTIYNRPIERDDELPNVSSVGTTGNKMIDLPYIPMEKWNPVSKETLIEQVNKYLILK